MCLWTTRAINQVDCIIEASLQRLRSSSIYEVQRSSMNRSKRHLALDKCILHVMILDR